ncbi:MAG: hypothetical protein F6K42_08570 [Leptolyngbya sp. SIO1D8]|nr:hypothetical protein [Leptolyngbya sp. SIO1D8]
MERECDSPLALSLLQIVPSRLKDHSYSILELAQELAKEFECPLCEILTPMSEALEALAALHQVEFDTRQKRVVLV